MSTNRHLQEHPFSGPFVVVRDDATGAVGSLDLPITGESPKN
jgi:hypothetical protein